MCRAMEWGRRGGTEEEESERVCDWGPEGGMSGMYGGGGGGDSELAALQRRKQEKRGWRAEEDKSGGGCRLGPGTRT